MNWIVRMPNGENGVKNIDKEMLELFEPCWDLSYPNVFLTLKKNIRKYLSSKNTNQ